jgi:sulfide:quinone oxidoreductase
MADIDKLVEGRGPSERFEVLIAGAGVAGLEAAFALRELAGDRVGVTLVAPTDEFVYRPMAIAEPFRSGWAHHYPLGRLAADAGAKLQHDAVSEVDAENRVVRTGRGSKLRYDALVACLGGSVHVRYGHAITVDDARMEELLHGLVQDVEDGCVRRLAVVIPAPMPWPLPAYELALMCSERAQEMQTELAVTVLTPEDSPLSVFGSETSRALSRLLTARQIDVVTSAHCEVPTAKAVTVHPGGKSLAFDRVVALPELRGPRLRGLPHDRNGFIPIDEYGQVSGVDRVWAAGDATDFPVKHGGVSAQLADVVSRSVAGLIGTCSAPPPFEPVLDGVLLTGGLPRYIGGGPRGGHGGESELIEVSRYAAPVKIAARYLTPYLVQSGSSQAGAPA